MNRGIHVTDYDTIDYEAWASKGATGLRASVPAQDFKFYQENTYDLELESKQIGKMLYHPNFTYIKLKPTWQDVVNEFKKSGICDVTLNSRQLNHQTGFSIHRVVLLDITDREVIFHDPNNDWSGANRHEPLQHFRKVFDSMAEPELAHYFLV